MGKFGPGSTLPLGFLYRLINLKGFQFYPVALSYHVLLPQQERIYPVGASIGELFWFIFSTHEQEKNSLVMQLVS